MHVAVQIIRLNLINDVEWTKIKLSRIWIGFGFEKCIARNWTLTFCHFSFVHSTENKHFVRIENSMAENMRTRWTRDDDTRARKKQKHRERNSFTYTFTHRWHTWTKQEKKRRKKVISFLDSSSCINIVCCVVKCRLDFLASSFFDGIICFLLLVLSSEWHFMKSPSFSGKSKAHWNTNKERKQ